MFFATINDIQYRFSVQLFISSTTFTISLCNSDMKNESYFLIKLRWNAATGGEVSQNLIYHLENVKYHCWINASSFNKCKKVCTFLRPKCKLYKLLIKTYSKKIREGLKNWNMWCQFLKNPLCSTYFKFVLFKKNSEIQAKQNEELVPKGAILT